MSDMNEKELLGHLEDFRCHSKLYVEHYGCFRDRPALWSKEEEQAYAQIKQIVEQHLAKPKVDVEKWAEKLVNVAFSIAEQSGDTQRFIKAKRFLDDFSQAILQQEKPKVKFNREQVENWLDSAIRQRDAKGKVGWENSVNSLFTQISQLLSQPKKVTREWVKEKAKGLRYQGQNFATIFLTNGLTDILSELGVEVEDE